MRRINFLYYLSIITLIIGGILFVRANRHESTVKIIENLKDKHIVFYSSNFKRTYKNFKDIGIGDMEKLCIEGTDYMKGGGLSSIYYKIIDGSQDLYTLSGAYLDRNLKKDIKYILIDVNRAQSKHGSKYKGEKGECCPISIIISKKSKSYEQSLLFSGRVKSIIDKKYETLPINIITVDDQDYNQSKGYIGLLIELGDAANTYDEARESMNIFCQAMKEVINMTAQ